MSSHAQMKWDASQGKWIGIGPDHPYGLPYTPGRASVLLTLALVFLMGMIKVVNSRENLEAL